MASTEQWGVGGINGRLWFFSVFCSGTTMGSEECEIKGVKFRVRGSTGDIFRIILEFQRGGYILEGWPTLHCRHLCPTDPKNIAHYLYPLFTSHSLLLEEKSVIIESSWTIFWMHDFTLWHDNRSVILSAGGISIVIFVYDGIE